MARNRKSRVPLAAESPGLSDGGSTAEERSDRNESAKTGVHENAGVIFDKKCGGQQIKAPRRFAP